jgi:hypothetical protein
MRRWQSTRIMALLRGPGGLCAPRSRLVLAVYVACTLLVFSFILFEVLDVDASDFPRPTQTTSIKLVEPPHDLKRTAPGAVEGLVLPQPLTDEQGRAQSPAPVRSPLASPHARASRITLPRGALPDPSPSA